jgi:hypothetical protein
VAHLVTEWTRCDLDGYDGFEKGDSDTYILLTRDNFGERCSPKTVRCWLHRSGSVSRRASPRPY